jgi:hypothetical protein
VPAQNGGKYVGILVPVGGDRNAVVAIEDDESAAESAAQDWEDFGASAGKTGETLIEGSTWVGYPGEVDPTLQTQIEDCAF